MNGNFAERVREYVQKNARRFNGYRYSLTIVGDFVLVTDSLFDVELYFDPERWRLKTADFQAEVIDRSPLHECGIDLVQVHALIHERQIPLSGWTVSQVVDLCLIPREPAAKVEALTRP